MLNFLTTTTVCGFSLYHVLAFFLIYSCTGWCLEVIFAAATTGQLVNRGFLNGPVCPIYGFGMVIVLFTLTPLQDSVLLLYIGGVILPSALELVGGWALYKLYHTRWWDYSDFPFNIGGYICLEFSLLWGVGTLVVMRIVHPVVAGLVDMVPPFVGFVVMCVLYAVYAADVVVTAFAASGLAKTLDAMEQLADSIHAVSDAMTQLLGTTTLNADQKLDEQRLQLKLAAAEAREAAPKSAPCVKRWPPSVPRPKRPARPQSVLPRSPSSTRPKPPRLHSWPPRARWSAPPSCCVWNSWPRSCRPAAMKCRPSCCAPPASLARAACCAPSPA